MASLDALLKQARQLAAAIPAPLPEPPEYVPPVHDQRQLQAFLAIDENTLPESADPSQIHPQTQYKHDRWLVLYHMRLNSVREDDLAIVRRWVS